MKRSLFALVLCLAASCAAPLPETPQDAAPNPELARRLAGAMWTSSVSPEEIPMSGFLREGQGSLSFSGIIRLDMPNKAFRVAVLGPMQMSLFVIEADANCTRVVSKAKEDPRLDELARLMGDFFSRIFLPPEPGPADKMRVQGGYATVWKKMGDGVLVERFDGNGLLSTITYTSPDDMWGIEYGGFTTTGREPPSRAVLRQKDGLRLEVLLFKEGAQ